MELLKILRDPIWQAVGTLATAIGLFAAFGSRTTHSELAIIPYQTFKFSEYRLPEDKVKMLIQGLPSDLSSVQATYVWLWNKGDKPLRADDFVEPITVKSGDGTKNIFFVSSCSLGPAKRKSGSSPSTVTDLEWKESSEGWQTTPSLINPNESSCAVVVSELADGASDATQLEWTARIADWTLSVYASLEDYTEQAGYELSNYWSTSIILFGVTVYWFVLLQGAFFAVVAFVAQRSGWISWTQPKSLFRLWIICALSIATAEILVDAVLNGRKQAPIAWPLVGAQILLCAYLVYRLFRRRQRGSASLEFSTPELPHLPPPIVVGPDSEGANKGSDKEE